MSFISKYLLPVATFALIACSQKGEEPITPNVPVNLEVNLQTSAYRSLLSPATIVLVKERPSELSAIGFAGLALVHSLDINRFYAFDLSCPVENQRLVRVLLNGLELQCESCGTVYEALTGSGAAIRGVGRKPLRGYKATYDEQYHRLVIRN